VHRRRAAKLRAHAGGSLAEEDEQGFSRRYNVKHADAGQDLIRSPTVGSMKIYFRTSHLSEFGSKWDKALLVAVRMVNPRVAVATDIVYCFILAIERWRRNQCKVVLERIEISEGVLRLGRKQRSYANLIAPAPPPFTNFIMQNVIDESSSEFCVLEQHYPRIGLKL